jgi:hypothetical protein
MTMTSIRMAKGGDECVRIASRVRNGNSECRQGFVHHHRHAGDAADLVVMLSIARAASHYSGAALRRVELPVMTAQSFGRTFHASR